MALDANIPDPRGGQGSPAPRKRKKPSRDDIAFYKGAVKRSGMNAARAAARADGFSDAEFDEMIAPPPKPKPKPEGEGPLTPGRSPDGRGGEGEEDGPRWTRPSQPVKPLADDCPVKPLGRSETGFHYLDPLNQLATLTATDHSAMGLRALFGTHIGYLWATWPKFNESRGNQSGFQADRAAESLMLACSLRGVFDAPARVRGTGAWLSDAGSLVLHAGDAVLIDGEWRPPGEYGRYLYTANEATIRPAEGEADHMAAIGWLLGLVDTWNWRKEPGETPFEGHRFASLMLLGWIASAIVGGALRWRPLMWLTGEAASGKSMLFALISAVLGDLIMSEDTSPAFVRTKLGQSTKPVLLDEAENSPNSRRALGLIETARIAASGGSTGRSSADHRTVQTTLRSSFLFSSIIIPPMLGQDISRFVVLDMDPIQGVGGLTLDVAKLRRVGAILRRRVLDGWPRLDETLAAWRATLVERGHSSRGADTYGYLLAFADLALWDEPADGDTRRDLAGQVSKEQIEAKTSGSDGTAAMLQFLATTAVDAFRGGTKWTVARLIDGATEGSLTMERTDASAASCRDILRDRGIYIARDERTEEAFPDGPPPGWKRQQWRVTLPNQHEGLRLIFQQSRWRTEPGATGGWVQAMRRLPGVLPENSRKLGGRGWSVPVSVFLQIEE
jgi:hypothetical protein